MKTDDAIPHPDRDAMYRLFEESPGDLAAYGVMADIMDELGYATLAHAYRWMGRRGRFPHKRTHYAIIGSDQKVQGRKVPAKFRWAWYAGDLAAHYAGGIWPKTDSGPHGLPPLIIPGTQKVYPSHQAAVMALAKSLQRLKDAYDLDPPKKGL